MELESSSWSRPTVGWKALACLALILFGQCLGQSNIETGEDARERIQALHAEIAYHDDLYYKKSAPEISDFEYDQLKLKLADLEQRFPDATIGLKEIEQIGDDQTGRFPVAQHISPMLSLEKAYSEAEFMFFHQRCVAVATEDDIAYSVEPKYDGIAISLLYENGVLERAVTRGDGREGDEITANVLTIESVPKVLKMKQGVTVPRRLELRGELYFSFATFERINREQEARGAAPFANPRNLASGTAKLSDAEEVAARGLSIAIFGYGAWEPSATQPESQFAFLSRVSAWGLPTAAKARLVRGWEEALAAVRALEAHPLELEFPIDGAVVKVDARSLQADLGVSSLGPRWAIAYKFPPKRMSTRLKAIEFQVGRSGVLSPVAVFEPITLDGSEVGRAYLYNRENMERLDLRVGDAIFVEKSGEIIPQVVGLDRSRRPLNSEPFVFPQVCPSCGSEIEQNGALLRCGNDHCPGRTLQRIAYFASDDGVQIDNLGEARIEQLMEAGLLRDIPDLYRLQRDALLALGADTAVSTDQLLAAIEASKQRELWRFINGLSIPSVGTVRSKRLARVIPSLRALLDVRSSDFEQDGRYSTAGLGSSVARSIEAYFSDVENRKRLEELLEVGIRPRNLDTQNATQLEGLVFVLTGKLAGLPRHEAIQLIESAGGIVRSAVSSQIDYLVAGEAPGSKLDQARTLGVAIIGESEFKALLNGE